LALIFGLTGCVSAPNPEDPLENFNRAMFSFNDKVDQVALKPVAETYRKVLPPLVQTGVGNFFGNVNDVSTSCNNLMQARMTDGLSDASRILVNTTLGLGGVLDLASDFGMPKHDQDFGQTLGRWGVRSGPYLVLPLLGSTTMRDALGMPVDFELDPWGHLFPVRLRNTGAAIRVVDYRAYNLNASGLLEDAALDKYEFVRDAYLQRRRSKIYTGSSEDSWQAGDDTATMSNPPVAGTFDTVRRLIMNIVDQHIVGT
jgi:phospholipid-binding lipoprotein MlaA